MRTFISIIMLALAVLSVRAQKFSEESAVREISEAAAEVQTLQCNITQTKSLKMLGDNMVSTGVLYCMQPDKLRWQYTTPYSYTFILNGTKVGIQKGDKNDVIDVNQNKLFKEIARIMMNSVLGKCLSDKKSFQTSVAQSGDSYAATLLPLKREMKDMFTKIVLYYDRNAKVIDKVFLCEKNGDSTTIVLSDIKKNSNINATVFQIN